VATIAPFIIGVVLTETRLAKLVESLTSRFEAARADHVRRLLTDLLASQVGGLDRFIKKLERSVGLDDTSEFNGTIREGVYARYLARNGGRPTFEPQGATGPDLGVEVKTAVTNLEIKRLLDSPVLSPTEDLESWYNDETDSTFDPGGQDRLTDKLRAIMIDAAKQLVRGEPNIVVLSDWSVSVTRGNFRRAIELLQEEIALNGTYGRISAVQYDSNWLQATNTYLWLNPSAEVLLPEPIVELLESVARDKNQAYTARMKASMDDW
jgi:hypothetical protein